MCPQKVYYKAFILQTNWCSLPQEFSTPTRLKIQTNDTFKLLDHNFGHY